MHPLALNLLEAYCLGDDTAAYPLWDIMSESDETINRNMFGFFLSIVVKNYQERWIDLTAIVDEDSVYGILKSRLDTYLRDFGFRVNRYYLSSVGHASLLGCIACHEMRETYDKSRDAVFLIKSINHGVDILEELDLVRQHYPSNRFWYIS